MNHNRKLLVPLVILLAIAAACAPTPTPVPTAAPPTAAPVATTAPPTATTVPLPAAINIGASVPLTGRYASGGAQGKNGYELGVEDVNKAGGGDFGTDMHAAAAGVAEKNKTPYLGVAFALYTIHQQGYKYLFSPFPKSPSISVALFQMIDTLNPKPTKYAIFAEKTDWGAENQVLWRAEISKRGGTLVVDDTYAPSATDYTAMITKARDGGAE